MFIFAIYEHVQALHEVHCIGKYTSDNILINILLNVFQSISRKLSKRNSGGIPAALRRKLSISQEGRGAAGSEEVLEGSGALNYALNVADGSEEG